MSRNPLPIARAARLRLAVILGLASILATLAVLPYAFALLSIQPTRWPVPVWVVGIAQAAQTGVLCFLLAWAGLTLGERYGLGAPRLNAWINHTKPVAPGCWRKVALLGAATGLGLALFAPSALLAASATWGMVWRGALASLYGGVAEEILCRLFLVSLLVYVFATLNSNRAQPWVFMAAIVLAAVLFGLGHLPAARMAGLVSSVPSAMQIVALNSVAGIAFGTVYWRYGLEHAFVTHFSADIVLHVIAPVAILMS